jgi:hypothetical protein
MAISVNVKHQKELGAYTFTFSFKKNEFNAIKAMSGLLRATIPASHRDYNPNSHEWTVLDQYWPPLKEILQKANWTICEEVVVAPEDFFYNQGSIIDTPISREDLANQLLAMLGITAEQLADSNAAKKAYRKAALLLHPDRNGGDGSRMSELNSVWSSYNATSTSN